MIRAKYYFDKIERKGPIKRSARQRVKDFSETYRSRVPNTLITQATRCVTCAIPNCEVGCPLSNHISYWAEMTADGSFEEASRIAFKTNPLPEITGRICPQDLLCEASCVLKEQFGAVTIGAIERFVSEEYFDSSQEEIKKSIMPNGVKVAVIGSGPAGISCSDFLNRMGYSVNVYERDANPGGLLHYGIPAFKMDQSIVKKRVTSLEKRGVHFQCNRELGKDVEIEKLKREGFRAIFLGLGAKRQIDIGKAEGRGLGGITTAYEYLTAENGNTERGVDVKGRRVLVLGGGDTALDCARTALRKGAHEVTCIYREKEAIRPGSPREYESTTEEGVKMVEAHSPLRFIEGEGGRLEAVQFLKIDSSKTDNLGRMLFREIPGTEKYVEADVAIISFGFLPEIPDSLKDYGIEEEQNNSVRVGANLMTSIEGIFSGGDIVRGSSLVVHAIKDGRDAATSIDQYLKSDKP